MRRWASVVVALSLPALMPAIPAAAAASPLPRDATIHTRGHGWGHARGLGQWGAKGMADSGSKYTQILTHYYSGVTWGTRSATEDLRIMVEESSDTIVTSDAAFSAAWSNGAAITSSDSTYRFLRARYSDSKYRLERASSYKGPWSLVASSSMYVVFHRGSAFLDLVFSGGRVRTYRGSLIARLNHGLMRSINQLQLQEYLYAVVPQEMPSSWPTEALRAQAVAARTYAAYKKDHARSKGYMFDICATTSCQVYGGYGTKSSPSGTRSVLERASTNRAAQDTSGKVLLYSGKPILAEYSSSTGGYSAPGNVAYQKAVPDPGDSVSPHHDWQAETTVAQIEAHWPQIGRLIDVQVTKRNGYGDWGGRVLEMNVVGTSSTVTMSGNGWAKAFPYPSGPGVQSDFFTIQYWRGDPVSIPSSITIPSGDTATVPVQIRNTGTVAWSVGGYVRLATPAASQFAGSDWISSTRAASVSRNVTSGFRAAVAPGQVAEFKIPLHTAGLQPGVYSQTFTPIADGWSTMSPSFAIQFEVVPTWNDEAANLLTDGSFESPVRAWTISNGARGDGSTTGDKREGTRSLLLSGGESRSAQQTVRFSGPGPRRFTLGGWNKTIGSSASGGSIYLWARAVYTDGTTRTVSVPFATSSHAWTYRETSFTTSSSRTLSSITVGASYSRQTGKAYFDAIRLLESPAGNASFESGLANWTTTGLGAGDGATQGAARDGSSSLTLAGGGTKRLEQSIVLAGRGAQRYVLSAWNRTVGTDTGGGAMEVRLRFFRSDGTSTSGAIDIGKTAHDWTRQEIAVVAPANAVRGVVEISRANQTGTLYVDGLRIVRTLTEDVSFESGLAGWSPANFDADDGIFAIARDGVSGLRLGGTGHPRVLQTIHATGSAGTTFVVSAWNRSVGTISSGGLVGVVVSFRNSDGTSSSTVMSFSGTPHPWTFREASAVAPKRFTRVDVYAVFYDQRGRAYFDSIRLARG